MAQPWYRAPELLLGASYNESVDVWAIGCLVYEMATGHALFPGENDVDQLYVIQYTMGPLPANQRLLLQRNHRVGAGVHDTAPPASLAHGDSLTSVGLQFKGARLMGQKRGPTLKRKCLKRLGATAFSFLTATLSLDASQRPSADLCRSVGV